VGGKIMEVLIELHGLVGIMSHREECNMLQNCTRKGEREILERDFGTR
jgi:hypothetical protein